VIHPGNLYYSFSGGSNNTRVWNHWSWSTDMTNVVSTGSWQMITTAVDRYRASIYNQMRFNGTWNSINWVPDANTTLANNNWMDANGTTWPLIIGGGVGILGDQISVTVATFLAYQQEVGAYSGSKYQSTGSVVARNANANNNSYDLSVSNVPGTLIDQNLMLVDRLSNDTVTTAGADYVNTGAGDDRVLIKDFAFRHIDAGQGSDTLELAVGFTGRSTLVLSDFASNYRGLTGATASNNFLGSTAIDIENNRRVNDSGYHRLMGFEKLDFVQRGDNRKPAPDRHHRAGGRCCAFGDKCP